MKKSVIITALFVFAFIANAMAYEYLEYQASATSEFNSVLARSEINFGGSNRTVIVYYDWAGASYETSVGENIYVKKITYFGSYDRVLIEAYDNSVGRDILLYFNVIEPQNIKRINLNSREYIQSVELLWNGMAAVSTISSSLGTIVPKKNIRYVDLQKGSTTMVASVDCSNKVYLGSDGEEPALFAAIMNKTGQTSLYKVKKDKLVFIKTISLPPKAEITRLAVDFHDIAVIYSESSFVTLKF